jgi:hypothetical protein
MANFPKEIAEFMARYSVSFDEVWKIPQGNAYAVKHKALERVAAEQKIEFGQPTSKTCDLGNKMRHGRIWIHRRARRMGNRRGRALQQQKRLPARNG